MLIQNFLMSKIKQLISIVPYKFTGDEVGEVKRANLREKHCLDFIPKYCLTGDGKIVETYFYLQFIESGTVNYFLFDIHHIDALLNEDISNTGFSDIFDKYKDKILKIFNEIRTYNFDGYKIRLLSEIHLVVEIEYISSGLELEQECDIYYDVLGYLDDDLKLVKI